MTTTETIAQHKDRNFKVAENVKLTDNERIAELEGHRGHAMEVLKANAIDFARQIDELRCVLIESSLKVKSKL